MSDNSDSCIICLNSDTTNDNELIKPCVCNMYKHQKCLEEWMKINGNKCEICKNEINYNLSDFTFDCNKLLNVLYLSLIKLLITISIFDVYCPINWITIFTLIVKNICYSIAILYILVINGPNFQTNIYTSISGLSSIIYLYIFEDENIDTQDETAECFAVFNVFMYLLYTVNDQNTFGRYFIDNRLNTVSILFNFLSKTLINYFLINRNEFLYILVFLFYCVDNIIELISYLTMYRNNTNGMYVIGIKKLYNVGYLTFSMMLENQNTYLKCYIIGIYMTCCSIVILYNLLKLCFDKLKIFGNRIQNDATNFL